MNLSPARPTFTSTGSTKALSAKVLILAGMVALNISVCRWLLKNDSMSRICTTSQSSIVAQNQAKQDNCQQMQQG
jgi:hypothetical protein